MQLHQLRAGLTAEQAPLRAITVAMSELIDEQVKHVRSIAANLRPAILDDFGLLAAIEWQVGEFRLQTGIECVFEAKVDDVPLSRDALTAAFRIFQEALTNVARHSRAARVEVSLDECDGHLHLQVRDNGQGIAAASLAGKGSLGLMGMRERAFQAGGELEIDGAPGGARSSGSVCRCCARRRTSDRSVFSYGPWTDNSTTAVRFQRILAALNATAARATSGSAPVSLPRLGRRNLLHVKSV